MGTTGVIFAAIAIAWLAYLVPHFVRRREGETGEEGEEAARFSDSVRVVRSGTAPLLDQDLTELREYEVSTPVTRRAAVADLRRLERVAASRRRTVLSVLLIALCAAISVCVVGWVGWWLTVLAAVLVAAFVAVSRVSVQVMRRDLDARYAAVRRGSEEATVFLSRKGAAGGSRPGTHAGSTAFRPQPAAGLWDPVPITVPTYVSKPLAPRTVRTIDLSGPGVTSSGRRDLPVTADAPQVEVEPTGHQSAGHQPAAHQRREAGGAHVASA